MSFGKDYTEKELAQLAELTSVFDRLYPADSANQEFGISVAILRTYFVPSSHPTNGPTAQWCSLLKEINGEIVVRLGQNLRKTKNVMNRLLVWRTAFIAIERESRPTQLINDNGRTLGLAWTNGLVEYFKQRLEKCFGELNIRHVEDVCIAKRPQKQQQQWCNAAAVGTPLDSREPPPINDELLNRCISSAQAIVNPQMSTSPYFVRAIVICREMLQALQLVQGLLYIFCPHYILCNRGSNNGISERRSGAAELNFDDDHLAPLRTSKWLFRFILLFLGAMDLLQDTQRDAAMISSQQLDYAIHCIACLVAEVDSKRKDSDVKATLDALVLGHVKNACLMEFPPSQTLALLDSLHSHSNNNSKNSSGNSTEEDVRTSADLLVRYSPLLQQILVRYPAFMTSITSFSRRNDMEEWGVAVMLASLYCWDVATPPQTSSAKVGMVRYSVPSSVASSGYAENEFVSTVMYSLTRETLRPLLSQLFAAANVEAGGGSTTTTAAAALTSTGGLASAAAGNEETATGSGNGPVFSAAEQKLCALLLGVVSWLDSVHFLDAARMPRWSAIDVGLQPLRDFNIGRWCMGRVLREVLNESLDVALQQVEEQVREAPATAAQDDPLAPLATRLLQYLLRVERVWNALTEHTIELDSSAFDYMRSMGVKVLPRTVVSVESAAMAADSSSHGPASRANYDTGFLVDYKYEFYEAVQDAMKAKWPKAYADLLTDPLLYGIHLYLMHAESAAQRGVGPRAGAGGGGGPAAGPRGVPAAPGAGGHVVGVKRPPPPGRARDGDAGPARAPTEPETVVLGSKDDLHGALRLVRCIKNRDHFIHRFTITVRERLLMRPAPDVIADADLERNKKRCEQEVEQFLTTWLNDTALLKTVRELHSNYAPQTTTFNSAATATGEAGSNKDFKLSSTILDWRLWGDNDTLAAAAADTAGSTVLPGTAAELRMVATQTAAMSTSATAPLPFPNDALPYLEQVERRYCADHGSRMLRWDWQNHVFTTFTLMYPKENGRVTTVSGTLLLQRLFLAIAAYGRAGVELETLAKRAGLDERRVLAVLKPCIDRDRLIVRVGDSSTAEPAAAVGAATQTPSVSVVPAASPSTRLALNYNYTRPPSRPRSDFVYWPNLDRRRFAARGADQDATVKKRRDVIKTSIMQVMKQVQRIHHDELYAMVREKNAKRFEVTVRNFKQEIEDLIGKDFMARADGNPNEYVFRA